MMSEEEGIFQAFSTCSFMSLPGRAFLVLFLPSFATEGITFIFLWMLLGTEEKYLYSVYYVIYSSQTRHQTIVFLVLMCFKESKTIIVSVPIVLFLRHWFSCSIEIIIYILLLTYGFPNTLFPSE